MRNSIGIVIAAYNRPHSLERLLNSIHNADCQDQIEIDLIISIDFSGNDLCYKIADLFQWNNGQIKIIKHKEKLGLKKHILFCGDQTQKYDIVIMLEDDLYVSKYFLSYAIQVCDFYKNDNDIAGFSLYNYKYNEFAQCPFDPILDSYDNYFMQVPCSWGQIWTRKQWSEFREYELDEKFDDENIMIPDAVFNWPKQTSWKRSFFKFMVEKKKYFVYPRVSLTTNFGDAGQHYSEPVSIWQTDLLMEEKQFKFSELINSISIYDSYMELSGNSYNRIKVCDMSVCFDLNGLKSLKTINTEYLISIKKCINPIIVYQANLYPYEVNILQQSIKEQEDNSYCYYLGKTSSFINEKNFNRFDIDLKRLFINSNEILNKIIVADKIQNGNKIKRIIIKCLRFFHLKK